MVRLSDLEKLLNYSYMNDLSSAATPTRLISLQSEVVLPVPSAVVGAASRPKTSNSNRLSGTENHHRKENPEWRHVAECTRQDGQTQENIRRPYHARIEAHFVQQNCSGRYNRVEETDFSLYAKLSAVNDVR